MDSERIAVVVGVAGELALVVLAGIPYALFDAGAVGTYYGVGFVGPLWIVLLGGIAAFALLAGLKRRTDPAMAAGIAITFGAFAAVLALGWAVPAGSVAAGFDVDPVFGNHPMAVVLGTLLVEGGAGWYAWAVLAGERR